LKASLEVAIILELTEEVEWEEEEEEETESSSISPRRTS